MGKRGAAAGEKTDTLTQLRSTATCTGSNGTASGKQPSRRSLSLKRNLSNHLDQVLALSHLSTSYQRDNQESAEKPGLAYVLANVTMSSTFAANVCIADLRQVTVCRLFTICQSEISDSLALFKWRTIIATFSECALRPCRAVQRCLCLGGCHPGHLLEACTAMILMTLAPQPAYMTGATCSRIRYFLPPYPPSLICPQYTSKKGYHDTHCPQKLVITVPWGAVKRASMWILTRVSTCPICNKGFMYGAALCAGIILWKHPSAVSSGCSTSVD